MSSQEKKSQRKRNTRRVGRQSSSMSNSSQCSVQSRSSMGIGPNIGQQQENTDPTRQSHLKVELIKLRPEGNSCLPAGRSTYDCVVYLLYCVEHDRIAVTLVDGEVMWFPFVTKDGRSWQTASQEGLRAMLERTDADGSLVQVLNLDCATYSVELFRVQNTPHCGGQWSERLTQFVTVRKCQKTCESVNNITWVSATDLLATCNYTFWGPEVRYFYEQILPNNYKDLKVTEHCLDPVLQYVNATHENSTSVDFLTQLLQSCQMSAKLVCDLYDDYLSHCYPAYYMNLPSLRIYLLKCGFVPENSNYGVGQEDRNLVFRAIFNACIQRPKRMHTHEYIDFQDICYALMAMDPATNHDKPRDRFLFGLYDLNNDGQLTNEEIDRLITDNPGARRESFGNSISISEFHSATQQDKLPKIKQICRMSISIVARLQENKKRQIKKRIDAAYSSKTDQTQNHGMSCRSCRTKKFDYGQHCVLLDSSSRCVEPKLYLEADKLSLKTRLTGRSRYSAECVFRMTSIGNVFFDYIRNRKFQAAGESDQVNFCEHFKSLCESIAWMVKREHKIIKRQSPALVMGDLHGNLDNLLAMETQFWCTVPACPKTLVFLGNYTGNGRSIPNYSIEVITYLFALKYLCPNKVILLRGIQETRAYNEKTLLPECKARYGEELGTQAWEAINSIFEKLPLVAVLNESIVCLSSGIPKEPINSTSKLSQLFETSQSHQLQTECTIFQEFVTNQPDPESAAMRFNTSSGAGGGGNSNVSKVTFKANPLLPNGYFFTWEAFRKFMSVNQFSLMIRSNDNGTEGYRVCFNRRCVTIISSSNPSEGRFNAVLAMVRRAKVELVQIGQ